MIIGTVVLAIIVALVLVIIVTRVLVLVFTKYHEGRTHFADKSLTNFIDCIMLHCNSRKANLY